MAKLKFNPNGYQDLGAYALLKNIVENGHLVAEDLDYIPLSGTTAGNPITGDIEKDSNVPISIYGGDKNETSYFNKITLTDDSRVNIKCGNGSGDNTLLDIGTGGFIISQTSGTDVTSISLTNNLGLTVSDNGASAKGIIGASDYSVYAKEDPNAYVQYAGLEEIAGKIIELGTITYTDLNAAGADTDLFIVLNNKVPANYYVSEVLLSVNEGFDIGKIYSVALIDEVLSQDAFILPVLYNKTLDEVFKCNMIVAPTPRVSYVSAIHVYYSAHFKFGGGADPNPRDFTIGSLTIKAIVKKFPQ